MSESAPLLPPSLESGLADALNQGCFCFSLDADALARALDAELGHEGLSRLLRERCPDVFAAQPVFVGPTTLQTIAKVIEAIESVVALPAYRDAVLAQAPAIARLPEGPTSPRGVFFGYDFHLNHDKLGLIEINTNAGGAMLNAVLARAQRACCNEMDGLLPTAQRVAAFQQQIIEMFRLEWRLAGNTGPLRCVAIVDESPTEQYLYPEFLLFEDLFARHGIQALIAAPQALTWRDQHLWHGDQVIDLVYNRLTDFYLESPGTEALREAWLHRAVTLTPHPQAHALYADKRRLALFSSADALAALGVPEPVRELLLTSIPATEVVSNDDADRLWADRRKLFFKPWAGYGSRAAYRGDKLTRRVWDDILAGHYVAQQIVAPGERQIDGGESARTMKFDLRAYAYAGKVQWTAARLYQGQTTNFRTQGGGFAPVFSLPMP